MLYLEAPFYFINGVTLYRDHADPLQYYFMPMSPRLRRIKDPATDRQVPQIQLIKYRSAVAGAGGFLNFDVHVGLEQDELDDLASELRHLARLPELPRLVPVPLLDGSVRMMLFGQESPAPPTSAGGGATSPPPPAPPAAGAPPKFVLRIDHAAKPALYGDNQAAFSVQLDQYGTAVLEQALKGEMAPVAVIYALDYLALRPAFSVRLHVDWNRVQSYLDETFGHEGLFDSTQIETAVNKLRDDRAIVLEADDFVPDTEDQGATRDRFQAAMSRVQDMITDSFFQPSVPPMGDRPDGWDKAREVIGDINKLADRHAMSVATGGISAIVGTFSYKKQDFTRIDQKRLDVTVSERSAVRRTIYPQGHLTGLFRVLRDGDDPARYILSVDADDPWFQRRRVRVISRADLAADGIGSLQALLRYDGRPKDVVLDKPDAEAVLDWASIVENGAVKPEVEAEYTVNFKDGDRSERPMTVRSKPVTVLGEAFELRPRELYSIVRVPVIASPNYPWDRYPQVQVELRYEDAGNAIRMDDMLLLDKGKPSGEWRFFVLDPARRTFQFRLLHRAADNRDIENPWADSDRELVDVRDPVPAGNRLRVDVMPVVARWEDVEQVFVDLTYDDPANDVHAEGSLTFSATDRAPKSFIVDIKDREHRAVGFKVTTVMKGGVVLEVPPSVTEDSRLLVRPDMKGRRIITVRPPADFAARGLEKVSAEMRYVDDNNALSFADRFDFAGPGASRKFAFDVVDPAHTRYGWRASFLFQSGLTSATDWSEADEPELVLKAPA
jgi:hypothetical protein